MEKKIKQTQQQVSQQAVQIKQEPKKVWLDANDVTSSVGIVKRNNSCGREYHSVAYKL